MIKWHPKSEDIFKKNHQSGFVLLYTKDGHGTVTSLLSVKNINYTHWAFYNTAHQHVENTYFEKIKKLFKEKETKRFNLKDVEIELDRNSKIIAGFGLMLIVSSIIFINVGEAKAFVSFNHENQALIEKESSYEHSEHREKLAIVLEYELGVGGQKNANFSDYEVVAAVLKRRLDYHGGNFKALIKKWNPHHTTKFSVIEKTVKAARLKHNYSCGDVCKEKFLGVIDSAFNGKFKTKRGLYSWRKKYTNYSHNITPPAYFKNIPLLNRERMISGLNHPMWVGKDSMYFKQ